MWYFVSPEVVFGEDALAHLDELVGKRALLVTDKNIVKAGFADRVLGHLKKAGIEYRTFDEVEPEPDLKLVEKGALIARDYKPDWLIGLGGGSAIDAAKAIWVLYERPDISPDQINPFEYLGLRKKAKLITIPTTSGTGSDTNWGLVLTDTVEKRKLGVGAREIHADLAIVDPVFAMSMSKQLTADTGMDALTQAIEAYTSRWKNDFSDGLSLKAIQLIFEYLPRAYSDGRDSVAREKMHNAASITGLAFGNSMAALAHSTGHAFGPIFKIPHGRAVGMFLPYAIEFSASVAQKDYAEIAHLLKLRNTEGQAAVNDLIYAIRELAKSIDQPLSIKDMGISRADFKTSLPTIVAHADMDTQTVTSARIPSTAEFERFFWCAYDGKTVDF
jgi:alcohol dehydrogenase class IV